MVTIACATRVVVAQPSVERSIINRFDSQRALSPTPAGVRVAVTSSVAERREALLLDGADELRQRLGDRLVEVDARLHLVLPVEQRGRAGAPDIELARGWRREDGRIRCRDAEVVGAQDDRGLLLGFAPREVPAGLPRLREDVVHPVPLGGLDRLVRDEQIVHAQQLIEPGLRQVELIQAPSDALAAGGGVADGTQRGPVDAGAERCLEDGVEARLPRDPGPEGGDLGLAVGPDGLGRAGRHQVRHGDEVGIDDRRARPQPEDLLPVVAGFGRAAPLRELRLERVVVVQTGSRLVGDPRGIANPDLVGAGQHRVHGFVLRGRRFAVHVGVGVLGANGHHETEVVGRHEERALDRRRGLTRYCRVRARQIGERLVEVDRQWAPERFLEHRLEAAGGIFSGLRQVVMVAGELHLTSRVQLPRAVTRRRVGQLVRLDQLGIDERCLRVAHRRPVTLDRLALGNPEVLCAEPQSALLLFGQPRREQLRLERLHEDGAQLGPVARFQRGVARVACRRGLAPQLHETVEGVDAQPVLVEAGLRRRVERACLQALVDVGELGFGVGPARRLRARAGWILMGLVHPVH